MRYCKCCETPIGRGRLCVECKAEFGDPEAIVDKAEALRDDIREELPDMDARRKRLIMDCGVADTLVHQEQMASEQRYLGRGARNY